MPAFCESSIYPRKHIGGHDKINVAPKAKRKPSLAIIISLVVIVLSVGYQAVGSIKHEIRLAEARKMESVEGDGIVGSRMLVGLDEDGRYSEKYLPEDCVAEKAEDAGGIVKCRYGLQKKKRNTEGYMGLSDIWLNCRQPLHGQYTIRRLHLQTEQPER